MTTLVIAALVVGALAVALVSYAIGVRISERSRTIAGEMGGGGEFRPDQPRRREAAVNEQEAGAGPEAARAAEELQREHREAESEAERSATVGRKG